MGRLVKGDGDVILSDAANELGNAMLARGRRLRWRRNARIAAAAIIIRRETVIVDSRGAHYKPERP